MYSIISSLLLKRGCPYSFSEDSSRKDAEGSMDFMCKSSSSSSAIISAPSVVLIFPSERFDQFASWIRDFRVPEIP
jgi:hypothetical protein